jgi:hypothetical protein
MAPRAFPEAAGGAEMVSLHRADVMHAMAIDNGHRVVARSQAFAVHAGLILAN